MINTQRAISQTLATSPTGFGANDSAVQYLGALHRAKVEIGAITARASTRPLEGIGLVTKETVKIADPSRLFERISDEAFGSQAAAAGPPMPGR